MGYLKALKSRNGKTYYSTRIKNAHWTKGYVMIPLKTTDYEIALERHEEVENCEKAIKRGVEFNFSWLDSSVKGRTMIKKLTLEVLVDKFIAIHKIGVRKGTINRYKYSYKSLMDVLGKGCPINTIRTNSIETWKKCALEQGRKNGGLNVDLRAFKTLLLWARDEDLIKKMPKIKMMPTKQHIKYINDSDWNKMMQSDIDDYYKDAFRLLRGIGVRRSDALKGRLDGSFLVVDAKNEKTGLHKEILLNDEQIDLVINLHKGRDEALERGTDMLTLLNNLTKAFQRCCIKIGIYESGKTNLHCLRNTYAVREYLKTKDIFLVCQKLHHKSVTQTERYARININRLEQDFPSLSNHQNSSKIKVLGTQKGATLTSNRMVAHA